MALIASSFTMEVILLIIGLYLFDGGIIRKFSAVGLFIYGLQTALISQTYVSDLSSIPANTSLLFTPQIQNDWAIMFGLLTMITFAWTFVSIGNISLELAEIGRMKDNNEKRKKRMQLIMEEMV